MREGAFFVPGVGPKKCLFRECVEVVVDVSYYFDRILEPFFVVTSAFFFELVEGEVGEVPGDHIIKVR